MKSEHRERYPVRAECGRPVAITENVGKEINSFFKCHMLLEAGGVGLDVYLRSGGSGRVGGQIAPLE